MKNLVKRCYIFQRDILQSTQHLKVSTTERVIITKVSIIVLPVKSHCTVYLNQPERVYNSELLYGQYLCLCMCSCRLYVEWPGRVVAG